MSVDKKPLLPAYLFNGEDELKIKVMLDALTERVATLGDITFNVQTFQGGDLRSSEPLLDALNTLPFAAPVRLVVIKEIDSASKQIQEALVDYLKTPSQTTVVAMTATALAKNLRLYKAMAAVGDKAIVDCSTKKRSELPEMIIKMASGFAVSIDRPAAEELLNRVGTSTRALDSELKKLASIIASTGGSRITRRQVTLHVPYLVEPKPWDLTDALALRDPAVCLQLLARIERLTPAGSLDITLTRLYAQCLSKIRELLTIKALKKRGEHSIASVMKRQEWQLRTALKGAALYSEKELIAILRDAPQTEKRLKSQPEAGRVLELWLLGICTKTASAT